MDSRPESLENVSRQIDELRSEVAEVTRTMSDMAKARGQVASDAVQSEGSRLYREGGKQLGHLQSRAGDMAHQARDVVRHEPMLAAATAMGIAAGIGLIVGIVMLRR